MTKQLFGSGEPSRLTRAHARLRNLERRIADPIGIRFNFANVGDYLSVTTTDDDGTGTGIAFTAENGKKIVLTGDGGIDLDTATMTVQNLGGAGTGLLTVQGYDLGMNFTGGFTEFGVAGFEVDSTLGVLLNDTSSAGSGEVQVTTTSNFVQLLAGADHGHTHVAGDVALEADGRINLTDHGGGINIVSIGGAGMLLNASSVTGAAFPGGGTRPIIINSTGSEGGTTGPTVLVGIADGDLFEIFRNDTFASLMSVSTAGVEMHSLPTSNPGGSGLLWKNGNVVNIT